MMWRIRKNGRGGFVTERGIKSEGGVLAPSGIGYTIPAFIVYESFNHDTLNQAERYVSRNNTANMPVEYAFC